MYHGDSPIYYTYKNHKQKKNIILLDPTMLLLVNQKQKIV